MAKQSERTGNKELEELTGKVVSCAMKIHRVLGPGFSLSVYKHALAFEMQKAGIKFTRDKELAIFYEGVKTGTVTVDFIIHDKVIVGTNRNSELDQSKVPHESLLQSVHAGAGVLLNFSPGKLEFATTYSTKK